MQGLDRIMRRTWVVPKGLAQKPDMEAWIVELSELDNEFVVGHDEGIAGRTAAWLEQERTISDCAGDTLLVFVLILRRPKHGQPLEAEMRCLRCEIIRCFHRIDSLNKEWLIGLYINWRGQIGHVIFTPLFLKTEHSVDRHAVHDCDTLEQPCSFRRAQRKRLAEKHLPIDEEPEGRINVFFGVADISG